MSSMGEAAFPSGPVTVLSVKHNILNSPSQPVHLGKAERRRIAAALADGTSDPSVFFADYTLVVRYQNRKELVLVNGRHFKFRSRTYLMKGDFEGLLSGHPD